MGTAAGDRPIAGPGSGGLGRAGATLASGLRIPRAATGGEARVQFAAHPGGQRFKLVLDQNRAMGLVPRSNLILRFEIGDLRRGFHIDQSLAGAVVVTCCGRTFFHFHPCRGP
jgi:hypothetical protein